MSAEARVPLASLDDLEEAIQAAVKAFPEVAALPSYTRKSILKKVRSYVTWDILGWIYCTSFYWNVFVKNIRVNMMLVIYLNYLTQSLLPILRNFKTSLIWHEDNSASP
jgi:hypothetical protein